MKRAFAAQTKPLDRGTCIKAIHTLARDLQMDEDCRKHLQANLTGVDSCKDMTVGQLRTVHARLSTLANDANLGQRGRFEAARKREQKRPKRPGRDERKPLEPPTKDQMDKIQHLADHLGLVGVAYIQLCHRIIKHAFPQSREEANKIVEALKAMEARGWHARTNNPTAHAQGAAHESLS